MTNDLEQRIVEHYLNRGNEKTFTGKYHAFYLLFYESSGYINNTIARKKRLKDGEGAKKKN